MADPRRALYGRPDDGIIRDTARPGGRFRSKARRVSARRRLAGVELGGTKIVCTLAGGDGEILAQSSLPTGEDPEVALAAVEDTLSGWWSEAGFAALGVASFGPVDLDRESPSWGFVTNTPKPGWRMTDLAARLERAFPVPIGFGTDVDGAALAEMRWGAGRGVQDFAYVTIGTGIGVGLVVAGRPVRGFGHGELGHVRVARLSGDDWPGACPFHGDCVEGLAAGSAIARRTGGRRAEGLAADDPVWTNVAFALAQLCHILVCAAAPRRILIGGGVASGRPDLLARIEAMLVESLAGYVRLPETPYIAAPGLGDQAGPLGPIALALDLVED
jgi:fructokinase